MWFQFQLVISRSGRDYNRQYRAGIACGRHRHHDDYLSGAGFTPSTVIQVNGVTEPTTYVGSTQISAVVAAAQLAAGGLLPVVAVDGGNSSASASPITLQITIPVPAISLIQPSPLLVGAPATVVTISGTGFVPGSSVLVDGTAAATTYISATQASVVVPASRLASAGSIVFQVSNAAPGGGMTTPSGIAIVAPSPTPTITAVTPSSIGRGSLDPLIQITGQNYTADSTAVWNGTPLVTRSVTPTQLLAVVPSALLSTKGTATVVIDNSTSLQPNSNAASVAIVDPFIPELDLIAPKTAPFNTSFTLQILGKYFQSTSTVLVNGVQAPVTIASDTGLYVSVPAEATRLPGVYQVTVTTPSPGGGTSQAQTLTAYAPQSNRHMVYNQATGLMYLSVAGSQGLSPSANSVVSFDPLTGTFGTPIPVGSEPNQLALSSDGSTLWVGLDGASAVRQVDLTHNVAAYQFSVAGANDAPLTVSSLSALPGSPDSVIVGSSNDSGFSGLAIYDHGVVRASLLTLPNPPEVLQVDSTANRVIVGDYYECSVHGYSAAGIAPSASPIPCGRASGRYGSLEITDGKLYSGQGYVSDITTSASLGQIDFTNPPYATGLLYVDSALGRIFSLHQTGIDFDNPNVQIVAFKHTDLSRVSPNPLPLYTDRESVSDLLRWGTNGLAFRNNSGVIALQSNLVNDLSTTLADLATTVVASGGSTTGTTTSFSVTVTNNGPQPSTGVALSALLPATGNLIAATPSLGNCSVSGNVICDLGNLPAGASAKVVFQVLETSAGAASLSVHATGAETDPTLANNTAADALTITGAPYNASPALQSIAPAAILAGSADTKLTLLGTNFSTDSLVTLDGNSLATTFLSATQLQAIVPATKLANLGWSWSTTRPRVADCLRLYP